jgi:uncharacterized membrane protein YjgN (DUF898 family)
MKVYCHECKKNIGQIPDEKIPLNKKISVICPQCQTKLFLTKNKPEENQEAPVQQPSSPQHHKPLFTGSAGEYFRIWIVNTFLTILTIGIYGAWAKVRTRHYFYAHTRLVGHPFDYLANPIAILKGNLIIAAGIIFYNSSQLFSPKLSIVIALLFALIVPFLIYKSLRFYAHNSAFRNIRFRFCGTLGESYKTYLLLPILVPLTLGLIIPYWAYRRKNYFFDNFAFGTTNNSFAGKASPFYKTYGKALLMFFATAVVIGVISSFGVASLAPFFNGASTATPEFPKIGLGIITIFISVYIGAMVLFTGIQQYIYARLTNYCWDHSKLGEVRFQSTIQARKLLWIRLTNILAIIFSIGLLTPWAKIRRTRYILDNLSVITEKDLEDFTSAIDSDESAYGDSAADFFDFEIGL